MMPTITRKRFSDFGQYGDQLKYWQTEAVQLSRGQLALAFNCFHAGNFILSQIQFNQDAAVKSASRPKWHALVVHLSPKHWCGVEVPAGAILSLPPGPESHTISHQPWEAVSVVVKEDELAGWSPPLARLADMHPDPERSVYRTDADAVDKLKVWVDKLLRMPVETDGEDGTEAWVDAIRDRLQQHLLEALGHRASPGQVSPVQRVAGYDLTLAALRLIHNETDRRISVGDIAQHLGVGPRAVERAFHQVIGISPAQYTLAERLNRVRYNLATITRQDKTVTSIALDHQFDHLSRFAMQYARLFDERPSDTLRSARRNFREAR